MPKLPIRLLTLYFAPNELARDTISLKVQDNVSSFTEWVVPNDWEVDATGIRTPHPVADAEGPQREWTGRGDIHGNGFYNQYNNGDAYSVGMFPNGFQLKTSFSLDGEYVQRDSNEDEKTPAYGETNAPSDERKVSFVANSGIKFGPIGDSGRYEVAIIDLAHWITLAGGIDSLLFQGDSVDFEAMQMSYEGEEVSRLLPGMLYKGEYKSGSAEHWRGLFDAHDIVETIVEGTPEYYRELIRRTLDWWAWSDEMIVVVSPVATDGVVKVYLKMTAAHSKNGNPSVISHPEDRIQAFLPNRLGSKQRSDSYQDGNKDSSSVTLGKPRVIRST